MNTILQSDSPYDSIDATSRKTHPVENPGACRSETVPTPLLDVVVENLAERLAANNQGRVTANHLMMYLPVSLAMISERLDNMVDRQIVFKEAIDGITTYEFQELVGHISGESIEGVDVYTGERLSKRDRTEIMAPATRAKLEAEIAAQANVIAWPADAAWQHEIIFVTATKSGPVNVAEVAGHTRLTLRQVKAKLLSLTKQGYCSLEIHNGQYRYRFPNINYPENHFRQHDETIHEYPASRETEWETKLIKILIAGIGIAFGCLAAAFILKIHFIFLLISGLGVSLMAIRQIVRSKEPNLIQPLRIL
ncbi:MAG: hypothetical protein AAFX93_06490 [Verrucomicrobiota bacterium]